ncbi:MAG: radical SAM protein [Veillonellales bacterium]
MTSVNQLTSPEYVQTSLAGAMALGLEPGRFYRDAYPGSLNLLLTYPDGCKANCSYCGLARERSPVVEGQTFIRVKWPVYPLSQITAILKQQQEQPPRHKSFGRICISMITHPRAEQDSIAVAKQLREAVPLPVSVLVSPTLIPDTIHYFSQLKAAGVDWVGIAVDAATPEIFAKFRGKQVRGPHQWSKYWGTVDHAVQVFGRGKVSIHLIVGLGETEQQMVDAIQNAVRRGAEAHLFSFCPEPGSALAHHAPPELGQYRRIQLAIYLLNHQIIAANAFQYNDRGQIVGYGRPIAELLGEDLAAGIPFMTSGCPDSTGCAACNRPYGNERPGPVLRNYPVTPNSQDMALIRRQIFQGIKGAGGDNQADGTFC